MSFACPSVGSGGRTARRAFEFRRTYVVRPKGKHQATVVWLHGLGDNGSRYAIVRDMTAAGLGLNKFCYAGLIAAHKNKTPITDDTPAKIIELVEQLKGWSSVEASRDTAENVMVGVSEEELYNTPTAEYVHRHAGFLIRQLTVYHVAFHACADLRNIELRLYVQAKPRFAMLETQILCRLVLYCWIEDIFIFRF